MLSDLVAAAGQALDAVLGWLWRRARKARAGSDPDYSETQDDFTTSMARWGYLHDQNN